jgi:hypothetical protein
LFPSLFGGRQAFVRSVDRVVERTDDTVSQPPTIL